MMPNSGLVRKQGSIYKCRLNVGGFDGSAMVLHSVCMSEIEPFSGETDDK